MLFLIGLCIVVGSVIGGYLMHHGELALLWQPNEVVIIVGAAIGATVIGNPLDELKETIKSVKYLFKTRPKSKQNYLDLLSVSFNIFKLIKVKGMLEIESHLENPNESEIFNKSPSILNDHHALDFIRDYLRMLTMGVDNAYQIESLMEKELEIYEHEATAPGRIFANMADSLPALGIVAAVLGVIITMKSITEPPEILGELIAAALVGTFLGVLLSYGVFNPVGHFLSDFGMQKTKFLECFKTGIVSHLNGNPPIITVEFMRKNIPENLRPDFQETDRLINGSPKE